MADAIVDIAGLIPIPLAGENEFPRLGDAISVLFDESRANPLVDAGRFEHAPAHHRLAVDLVHVLPAGAAAAHERELELRSRNPNSSADGEKRSRRHFGFWILDCEGRCMLDSGAY